MDNVNDDLATLTSQEKRAILAQLLAKRAAQPVTAAASFAQERMWVVEHLNPGSAVLHLPMTLRLKGVLDGAALARALDEIVMRHGVLRTAFMEINGQPTQVITPNLTCPLTGGRCHAPGAGGLPGRG